MSFLCLLWGKVVHLNRITKKHRVIVVDQSIFLLRGSGEGIAVLPSFLHEKSRKMLHHLYGAHRMVNLPAFRPLVLIPFWMPLHTIDWYIAAFHSWHKCCPFAVHVCTHHIVKGREFGIVLKRLFVGVQWCEILMTSTGVVKIALGSNLVGDKATNLKFWWWICKDSLINV